MSADKPLTMSFSVLSAEGLQAVVAIEHTDGEVTVGTFGLFDVRSCSNCGCTDEDCSGCIERTGQPCYWVAYDLCSACVHLVEATA